ncbi:hypothetical protein QFC24_004618 [Naganishia onofrii]|uniref:Uncharacterized protein n=1 Tax=Naganishia onofrii TaxID=1851511 RepID=A0ACC2XBH8_9TREE|nr:hypothetical protein QFC24_004618 [Naganishia onofrii]
MSESSMQEVVNGPEIGIENGMKLPYDLLIEISKDLAEHGYFRTVANLNATSRTVHRETLPTLYQEVHLEKEEVFIKCVGRRNTVGWAHTRYLHLSDTTYALLKQHQRYATGTTNHHSTTEVDLIIPFPKLVFISLAEANSEENEDRSLELQLYQPISLEQLAIVCSADKLPVSNTTSARCCRGSIPNDQDPGVTLFGMFAIGKQHTAMYHQGRPYHHFTKFVIKHKGRFIPGPPGNQLGLQTPDWWATRVPRDLRFDIQTDPFYAESKESAREGLCLILDLIKHSRWDRDNKGYRQPEADEFKVRTPLGLGLVVNLRGEKQNALQIRRYLQELATLCFVPHWIHSARTVRKRRSHRFVEMMVQNDDFDREYLDLEDVDIPPEEANVNLSGYINYGCEDEETEDMNPLGFQCNILLDVDSVEPNGDRHQVAEYLPKQDFPCDDALTID